MRYSTVFKFVAVILCAATLMVAVGSTAGLLFLTELGDKTVSEAYADSLESRAMGYTQMVGGVQLSQMLGEVPVSVVSQHYGGLDWESMFFNCSRVGYSIQEPEGTIGSEQSIPDDSRGVKYTDDFPLTGTYLKMLSTTPYEEYYPQATESGANTEAQVLVMPTQQSTAIYAVYIYYTDGHGEVWPDNGTQLGSLYYRDGTLTFHSDVGAIPEGDGWYPNHIKMLDNGGNVVYEVISDGYVILQSMLDTVYQYQLPAATVTTAAPVGTTIETGDYTAYDAIPDTGATVTSMTVTYADASGETVGSEGISSPELIGTVFHGHGIYMLFQSAEPMTVDVPQGCVITRISFGDSQGNLVFEANCPGGVGSFVNDEDGYLIFRGQLPGTDEEAPSETVADAGEPEVWTGFAREDMDIYAGPSRDSEPVGKVTAWQELEVTKVLTVDDSRWCRISGGWVPLEQVLLAESAQSVPAEALPAAEETVPPETVEVTIPETTVAEAAAENADATEPVTAAEETSALRQSAAVYTETYYDDETGQQMVAEFVVETIPEGYTMTVSLAEAPLRNELGWTLLRLAESVERDLLKLLGISVALLVLCVVYICCAAARKRGSDTVRPGGLNRIPLDLYLMLGGLGVTGLGAAAVYGSEYLARNDRQLAILFCGAMVYLACLVLVGFFFAAVAQLKTPGGWWWRRSFCGWCCRWMLAFCNGLTGFCEECWRRGKPAVKRLCGWLREDVWNFLKAATLRLWDEGGRLLNWLLDRLSRWWSWCSRRMARLFGLLPITWQFLATGFVLVFLLYIMMRTYKVGYILLGFGIFFGVLLYAASAFGILLENAKRMRKGDLDTKVSDRMLVGGFREFAGELNELAGVVEIAAQQQLKSERMKTELITNVSHDIKTPLTSIINYVDLLQMPHTQEQQEQYLEVLERQSHRLKKLIDDLMEMSKASTGNMTVEIQPMDAVETVNQALGEFADKLERAGLTPVFRQPEESIPMLADGRLVWRVMSNLLGNAVKYALPGTRVYVDVLAVDDRVIISMKNISRESLNVNAEELMERFVRGDASRNTEGSGLGLNIAQSLMELQKGRLEILVDGDLFKVTLTFPGL